ncbi:MAG: M36 family metallopeptidase, partial [Saprospiraceae bacterium]|nr:M36 family metallopeptidase [Saprospiraceae bacterium]
PWDRNGPGNPAGTLMWHNDGTEIYTYTRGNNAYAYEDTSGANPILPAPGIPNGRYSPDGGASLQFDFTLDLNNHPRTNIDAAITNLFFWNNLNHDIFYQYGFDEAAGNFQMENLGRGGLGNDPVRAEAMDGFRIGSRNNANFFTPNDGMAPRMQMYIWESVGVPQFTLNSPFMAPFQCVESSFSANNKLANVGPVTANVLYVGGTGCGPVDYAGFPPGTIAMVDRGDCNFTQKALFAEASGAIGLIVVQNNAGAPIAMGGTNNAITIPAVMISQADGALIKALPNVNVTMSSSGMLEYEIGDLDNGIITHEYGHGISNRLVAGPNNTSCLGNAEQMGEGWSDYFSLMLTTDWNTATPYDRRGIGTYALNQPANGFGIRPFPYSYDLSINPVTYADVANAGLLSQPHGIGTVWASMLWDMTWNIINQVGSADPDMYHGLGGNNIALQLVVDALKLTPCNPGFVDGRDAILLADQLRYNGLYHCAIWDAFARRGLGIGASEGSPEDRFDGVTSFSTDTTVTVSKTISPAVIREGETGTITISLSCGCENGSNNALDVEDILGEGLTYVSGGTLSGDTVSFPPIVCAPNTTVNVSYQVTADSCSWASPSLLFSENAEGSTMVMPVNLGGPANWSKTSTVAHGNGSSWFALDYDQTSDNALVMVEPVLVTGNAELSFFHRFETEGNFDGGVVEYSLDGGGSWLDAQPYFIQNGYNGYSHPFFRSMFNGYSPYVFGIDDFIESRITLSPFIGQSVLIRFRFLTDAFSASTGINGWSIDDITIRTVNTAINKTVVSRGGVPEDSVLCSIPIGLPRQSDNTFTCHDRVNISLNSQCLRQIEPEELITTAECANHLLVQLSYPKGTTTLDPANSVDVSHVGAEMTYRVIDLVNNNSCWGTIKVEDKFPPIIECANTTVSCLNAETAAANVKVADNCNAYGDPKVEILQRKWESFDCDADSPLSGYVARVIRATDVWGNFVECHDTIFIIREFIDALVCPDDVEVECTNTVIRDNKEVELLWNAGKDGDTYLDDQGYAHPWPTDASGYFPAPHLVSIVTGQPDAYFLPGRSDSGPVFDKQGKCQILFDYEDHVLPTCGKSYKIRRTWHIYDWCRGTEATCTQWIKIKDTESPVIDLKYLGSSNRYELLSSDEIIASEKSIGINLLGPVGLYSIGNGHFLVT